MEINANYVGVGLNTSANVICAPAYSMHILAAVNGVKV